MTAPGKNASDGPDPYGLGGCVMRAAQRHRPKVDATLTLPNGHNLIAREVDGFSTLIISNDNEDFAHIGVILWNMGDPSASAIWMSPESADELAESLRRMADGVRDRAAVHAQRALERAAKNGGAA